MELLHRFYAARLSRTFEDATFTATATLKVLKALGRNSRDGYIVNDGAGDFTVKFSPDGNLWGDAHTIKKNEVFDLGKIDIHSIIITHSGTDSAYRVMVI
jgi:hypothetical protein